MSSRISLRGLFRLIRLDSLRIVHNVGLLDERQCIVIATVLNYIIVDSKVPVVTNTYISTIMVTKDVTGKTKVSV